MSYTQLYYHVIFRTKGSASSIVVEFEKELYAYIMGYVNNKKSKLLRIGGTPDHVHMFISVHPSIAISDFMRDLKESSSKWLQQNPHFVNFKGWGVSYAAFSYSNADKETVINYIRNQKEHHKKVSFAEELRALLIEHDVEIDEKFFLKE